MNHTSAKACPVLALLLTGLAPLELTAQDYESFEARQSHPVDLHGSVLLAVNSPKGSLAVFDLIAGVPVFHAEIPVGVEPVSARARTATEAWVVNEVSDSLPLSRGHRGIESPALFHPPERLGLRRRGRSDLFKLRPCRVGGRHGLPRPCGIHHGSGRGHL